MVAFANTSGGTILLGVEDDGSISGLPDDKNYEEWVSNIARNNVVPALSLGSVDVSPSMSFEWYSHLFQVTQ